MGKVADRDIYKNKTGPTTGPGLNGLTENQGAVREGVGMLPPKEVTIHDGAISGFEEAALIVDTEGGGVADDLEVISDVISATEKLHPGMLITLRAKDPARIVTIKNSVSPNGINTADGNDIVLSPDWELPLRLVGGRWCEVRGRSSVLAEEAQSAADDAFDAAVLAQSTANAAKTVTDKVTSTPTANAVLQADPSGLLLDGWLLRAAPTGFSGFYAGDTPPDGWFEENGAPVSRTTYARLFAVIGTRYGVGDGSTTFNLPDSRGLSKKGWDHGRGVDPGRGLGTYQEGHLPYHEGWFRYDTVTIDAIGGICAQVFSGGGGWVQRTGNSGNSREVKISFGSGNTNEVSNMSYMSIIKY